MKVLWFTNTPCGAAKAVGRPTEYGGWLSALETNLCRTNDVELHVAFYHNTEMAEFCINSVIYHPISRWHSYGSKIKKRFDKGQEVENAEVSRLMQVVNQVCPDVIHVHGSEENFGLIQTSTDIPVVLSLQGILTPYSTQYFSGISFASAFKNAPIEGLKTRLFGYMDIVRNSEREKRILNECRWILGRTDWDKRVASILAPNAQYVYAGELLRKSFYEHAWCGQLQQRKIISTQSGGIYKGFETILRTAQILKSSMREGFEWNVIGLLPSSKYVKLCEGVTGIKAQEVNVNLLGMMDEMNVANAISDSSVFVHASHIENSPNSVCEAMLMGVPVIATDSGGTSSIVKNAETGILIQPGEPYSLAGSIIEVLNDLELAKKIGLAASKVAKNRHDSSKVVGEIVGAYSRAIKISKENGESCNA